MRGFFNISRSLAACLFTFLLSFQAGYSQVDSSLQKENEHIRTVIHLLGYIGGDYPGAVKNGEIVSQAEYAEMTEFSKVTLSTAEQAFSRQGPGQAAIIQAIRKLQDAVREKKDGRLVAALSNKIKQQVIEATGFRVSPSRWPDLARGKRIYDLNCASCHGAYGGGDGKAAARLDPPPTNFTDDLLMGAISPFQAYNTVLLGVMGTAMPSFPQLSEQEVWDVAFYIETLKYKAGEQDQRSYALLFDTVKEKISLAEAAAGSDLELLEKLGGRKDRLLSIRLHSESGNSGSLTLAQQAVGASLSAYRNGDFARAKQKALAAYLDGIEPVEAQLRAKDSRFTAGLEQQMFNLRAAIDKRKPAEQVAKEANASLAMITQANDLMQSGKLTFWPALVLSASILLREGLEAFLIIAVILALVGKTGGRRAAWWIHGGWLTAVMLGFLGWFVSDWVLHIGGKNREMMEGLVTLFAVGVLVSAGLWLHNKSNAEHWKQFVEEKIGKLVQRQNMAGLGLFSFMVVFREAFESILFLQAIRLETPPGGESAIGLGVLAALGIIAVLVVSFLRFSGRIPIRLLFRYSSWMIVILAVILVGNGVHAMQEAGFLPVTPFGTNIRLDWLGLYPTVETLLPQLALAALIIGVWYFHKIHFRQAL